MSFTDNILESERDRLGRIIEGQTLELERNRVEIARVRTILKATVEQHKTDSYIRLIDHDKALEALFHIRDLDLPKEKCVEVAREALSKMKEDHEKLKHEARKCERMEKALRELDNINRKLLGYYGNLIDLRVLGEEHRGYGERIKEALAGEGNSFNP